MLSKKTLGTGILVLAALSLAPPASAADPKKADTKAAADSKSADAKKAADEKAAADAKAAADVKVAAADGSPAATAKALYGQGIDLAAQKDYKGAEGKFLQAWAIQKSYDIAANLGAVETELGKHAEAALYFTYALSNFPASGPTAKREWIEARLKEARAKVATVSLNINVSGAEVRINGKVTGTAPLEGEQFLAAGGCKIEVTAPGYEPDVQNLTLAAGSSHKLRIELKTPPRSLLPAFLIGGAGIAGVAAGLALTIVSTGKYDEARGLHDTIVKEKGTCGGASPHAKCAALQDAAKASDALYAPGLGLLIGGAVLAAAGGAYLGYAVRGPAAPAEERPADRPARGPRITRVGVRGPGLFVEGSF